MRGALIGSVLAPLASLAAPLAPAAAAANVSSLGASSSSTSSSIQDGIVRPVGVPVHYDWRARCPALPWDRLVQAAVAATCGGVGGESCVDNMRILKLVRQSGGNCRVSEWSKVDRGSAIELQ